MFDVSWGCDRGAEGTERLAVTIFRLVIEETNVEMVQRSTLLHYICHSLAIDTVSYPGRCECAVYYCVRSNSI
jgi:hypothetical protein